MQFACLWSKPKRGIFLVNHDVITLRIPLLLGEYVRKPKPGLLTSRLFEFSLKEHGEEENVIVSTALAFSNDSDPWILTKGSLCSSPHRSTGADTDTFQAALEDPNWAAT